MARFKYIPVNTFSIICTVLDFLSIGQDLLLYSVSELKVGMVDSRKMVFK